jgi:hypothetical protein
MFLIVCTICNAFFHPNRLQLNSFFPAAKHCRRQVAAIIGKKGRAGSQGDMKYFLPNTRASQFLAFWGGL